MWGHEVGGGEHGRGEKGAEDPALAGPQGARLVTGHVAGQPGEEETRGG